MLGVQINCETVIIRLLSFLNFLLGENCVNFIIDPVEGCGQMV